MTIFKRLIREQRSSVNARAAGVGFLAFFVALACLPAVASAASDIPTISGVVQGTGIPMVNLTVFLLSILRVFFGLLGVIAIALLIYAGFIWMSSSGDPAKIDKAKRIIYNTIIGLIIIFSAFAISSFLISWLRGMTGTGTGGGTTNIPGGNGDWSRSTIGAGPIKSVYPSPNAVNVPINTRIAVTFKENINPQSLCDLSGGGSYCNGQVIKNVTICEINSTSSDCLAGSSFSAGAYAGTTVFQASPTDFKTFIFYPQNYLGNDDQQVRVFKVVLGNGIVASATNKSVFDGWRSNSYTWAFKTNGLLDFSPPEVAKLEIYPNPDNTADAYAIGTQSTTGSASVQLLALANLKLENPVKLNGTKYLGTALSGISATKVSGDTGLPADFLKLSTAGFAVNSATEVVINFTVCNLPNRCLRINSPANAAEILGLTYSTTGDCSGQSRCVLVTDNKQAVLTGSGLTITSSGNFSDAAGSTWSFTATPAQVGDEVSLTNGTEVIHFLFADPSLPDQISKQSVAGDGKTIITTNYYTVKTSGAAPADYIENLASVINQRAGSLVAASVDLASATKLNVTAKAAGENTLSLSSNSAALGITGSLSGTNRVTSRTALPPGSKPDPYNNSVFSISFTKAINPINIDQYIKVTINGATVAASTTLTNQYRTLELTGTYPCGVNSCGKTMYCWTAPNTDTVVSSPASITVIASSLKYCETGNQDSGGNEWCKRFGGTCQAGVSGGRCQFNNLFYPQALSPVDGIVDMANNSFNGNFNKAKSAKGFMIGNAEGQSGTGNGKSQHDAYNANDAKHFNGLNFSYANDNDANGDNFSWSFFISTQIDRTAPLIAKILPYGDQSFGAAVGETFRDPVRIVFNGLMRLATLQPGWGYGESKDDPAWNTRYLILKTITAGANPVGYWISSNNLDEGDIATGQGKGDGLADYTVVDINHNIYDQAVSYGPLAGNGLESITQNCLLPGSGPQNAGSGKCYYNADGSTSGCVTDQSIPLANRVTSTNPSSYGYLKCSEIDGAVVCGANTGSVNHCKAHYATSTTSANGSWIITKDFPTIINATIGGTGCCFGVCK